MLNLETGEVVEKTLLYEGDAVREFYAGLPRPVRVGIEASGTMQWFVKLLNQLEVDFQHEGQGRATGRSGKATRCRPGSGVRCRFH